MLRHVCRWLFTILLQRLISLWLGFIKLRRCLIMSDLSELYQEVILDHSKNPRNFRRLEVADRTAEGFNPLCGDHITVYLRLENDMVRDIRFQGSGCAISKASASLMTASIKGKTRAEAETLFDKLHRLVTGDIDTVLDNG